MLRQNILKRILLNLNLLNLLPIDNCLQMYPKFILSVCIIKMACLFLHIPSLNVLMKTFRFNYRKILNACWTLKKHNLHSILVTYSMFFENSVLHSCIFSICVGMRPWLWNMYFLIKHCTSNQSMCSFFVNYLYIRSGSK